MDSQVTRASVRRERVAKSRFRVAMRAEERVLPLWFSFWRTQERTMETGIVPMRASW
jgi:hypothetical protein